MRLRIFITFMIVQTLILLGLHLAPAGRPARPSPGRPAILVRTLQLTDLSLWTESLHTRHPSQADNFAAFRNHPSAPEHYPAGSLTSPTRNFFPKTSSLPENRP